MTTGYPPSSGASCSGALLNLGCGSRFHPAWTNVDLAQTGGSVIGYDLSKRVPFPDDEFEVVYHSHLLEHFPEAQALPFLRECHRVLKSGGIIRIAVPDLESIARIYLQALEEAAQGSAEWQHHYDWIMLELYDQAVREHPGGEMAVYLLQDRMPNKEFVLRRIGMEGRRVVQGAQRTRRSRSSQAAQKPTVVRLLRGFHRRLFDPSFRREFLIRRLLGSEYPLLQLGRFRRGGEVHLWMYDRHSLARLLQEAGFEDPQVVGPSESQIPDWTSYHLDTEPDGIVYKPDSLYMEAVKP